MATTTIVTRKALAHLRKDPKLARVIDEVGAFRFESGKTGTHFETLMRSIIFQQLATKAAATIHGRFYAIYGGRGPSPAELLRTPEEKLRAAGLSRQKLGYLRDLAEKAASGALPVDRLHELDDPEIERVLVQVKGIGVWTAQMFLIFSLGRPDVLPVLDLGIQKAVQRAYGLRGRPTPKKIEKIGAAWRPWATVASWYLWRSLDNG
jgi:DNA-3-methyladenine glycosylase II